MVSRPAAPAAGDGVLRLEGGRPANGRPLARDGPSDNRQAARAAARAAPLALIAAVAATPIGVCSIVAARVAGACDPKRTLAALGKYVFAVLLGLAVHGLVALPAMFRAATKSDASEVLRGGAPALAAAFATDSSSACLPRTIQCALRLGVPEPLARFALPLGATVNMNGTALYEALTVLFIAQTHGVDLSFGATLVVAATSTVAAVGAAAIPSAGMVTMLLVLQAAGLARYSDDVGALLALDWFLDRARTVVNVEGDLMVVAALARWQSREAPPDEAEDARVQGGQRTYQRANGDVIRTET